MTEAARTATPRTFHAPSHGKPRTTRRAQTRLPEGASPFFVAPARAGMWVSPTCLAGPVDGRACGWPATAAGASAPTPPRRRRRVHGRLRRQRTETPFHGRLVRGGGTAAAALHPPRHPRLGQAGPATVVTLGLPAAPEYGGAGGGSRIPRRVPSAALCLTSPAGTAGARGVVSHAVASSRGRCFVRYCSATARGAHARYSVGATRSSSRGPRGGRGCCRRSTLHASRGGLLRLCSGANSAILGAPATQTSHTGQAP